MASQKRLSVVGMVRPGFVAFILLVLLSGCTSIPERIVLDLPKHSSSLRAVDLRDGRKFESLAPEQTASSEGNFLTLKFGDEQFEPRLLTVLHARISAELGAELQGKTIIVSNTRVLLTQMAPPPTGRDPAQFGLLGFALFSGIENARNSSRANGRVSCWIEVAVDGEPISAVGQHSATPGAIESEIKAAIGVAIGDLIRNIRTKLKAKSEAPASTGAKSEQK